MTVGHHKGMTDTGRKRRRNEDSFIVRPPLFAIADGMGGAQAGEVASQLAVDALDDVANATDTLSGRDRVVALIQEANRRVYQRSSEDAAVSGMGTTMTAALVGDGIVWIGHVGDSRAYLVRDGQLSQITEDHSLVAELVKNGKLSPEEAETHPQRSVITRALGTDSDVDVDVFEIEPHAGDVFLICSDGLSSMVDDETILGLVEQHRGDLDAAAAALVNAANRGGGEDNITVVAFDIAEPGAEAAPLEETMQMPAVDEPQAPEDEDTLTEADAVPVVEDAPPERPTAVDTMVVPPGNLEELAALRQEEAAGMAAVAQSPARQALGWLLVLVVALGCAALIWVLTH